MAYRGHFDGASRGNPGQAGAGMALYEDGRLIWHAACPLGLKTNNEAEYTALGLLLAEMERRGISGAEICGDSKLVISQVSGVWKIKEPRLRELAEPMIATVKRLGYKCTWVPRAQNAEADHMSNVALDEGDFVEDLKPVVAAPKKEESVVSPEPPVEKAKASPAEAGAVSSCHVLPHFALKQITASIWVVKEGSEEFAVDLAHRCCSCETGRKTGKCEHIEQVLLENPFSSF